MPHTDSVPRVNALLLSAGLGTRLRPLTDHLPKCLMPIGQKPILGWWLDKLVNLPTQKILINTHYKANLVELYLNTRSDRDKFEMAYEPVLLGTAGTLKKHRETFTGAATLLIHGDNFSSLDIPTFYHDFESRPHGCHITMATFITDQPETCGIVETDSSGIVRGFHEKVKNPPGFNANGAVYLMDDVAFDFVCNLPGEVLDFSTQVLPHFVGKINVSPVRGYHIDIGSIHNWCRANRLVKTSGPIPKDSYYLRNLSINDSIISQLETTLMSQMGSL